MLDFEDRVECPEEKGYEFEEGDKGPVEGGAVGGWDAVCVLLCD